MKKKSSFKRFILIIVLLPIIVASILISVILGCSLSLRAVFHEPAILRQTDFAIVNSSGEVYFGKGSSFGKYSFSSKNHIDWQAFYKGNTKLNLKKVYSSDKYIVVNSYSPLYPNYEDLFQIFDYDFMLLQEIELKDFSVYDFLIFDDYLYYIGSFDEETDNNGDFSIYKYNVLENDTFEVANKISFDSTYFDGSNVLEVGHSATFVNHRFNGRIVLQNWRDETKEKTMLSKYCSILELHLENNYVVLKHGGLVYSFKPTDGIISFYDKAYLVDDNVIFAIYEKIENKECGEVKGECVCRYGQSFLITFDIKELEFRIIAQYEKGTFLIDYDLNNVQYYYNGNLYVDDIIFRECETITPGDLKTIKGQTSYPLGKEKLVYYLSYLNGEFYGIQFYLNGNVLALSVLNTQKNNILFLHQYARMLYYIHT